MASVTEPQPSATTLDKQTKKSKKRLSDGLVREPKESSHDHHHDHVHDQLIHDDRNSTGHKLIILGTVVFPLLGMATAIVLALSLIHI